MRFEPFRAAAPVLAVLCAAASVLSAEPVPGPHHPFHDSQECKEVAVTYMAQNFHSCLHIDPFIAPIPKPNGTECIDTPNYSDGTNGCFAYGANAEYCAEYGGHQYNQGSPNLHCCACGGGHPARFAVDDDVEINLGGKNDMGDFPGWTPAKISQVHTSVTLQKRGGNVLQEFAPYLVDVKHSDNVRTNRNIGNNIIPLRRSIHSGMTSVFAVRIDSEFLVRARHPKQQLELRRCGEELSLQKWRLVAAGTDQVHLQHLATGLLLGKSLQSKYPTIIRLPDINRTNSSVDVPLTEDSSTTKLTVSANSRSFDIWTIGTTEPQSTCLSGGSFGTDTQPLLQWVPCKKSELPWQSWKFQCADSVQLSNFTEHVMWLYSVFARGGVEAVVALPPWDLLDVDRFANPPQVKAKFRQISKWMHPDKQPNATARESAGLLFPLLQHAYDGMKNSNAKKFRNDAETTEQLYAGSKHVVELSPEMFAANVINATSGDLWLLILYSPRCSMSRSIVPVVELLAEHVSARNIRVGAFGCAVHGKAREQAKKIGFSAAFQDPLCKHFSINQTPMIFGSLGNFQVSFGSVFLDALPDQLLEFSYEAQKRWLDRNLIVDIDTADLMKNEAFNSSIWVVGFRAAEDDASDTNAEVLSKSLLGALSTVAKKLDRGGVRIGMVTCAALKNSTSNVDCTQEGSNWFPNVQIYGIGRGAGRGVSLLGEPFGEVRDVEVALEALTSTLMMTLNVSEIEDDSPGWLEEKPRDEEPSQAEGQSCSSPPGSGAPPLPELEGKPQQKARLPNSGEPPMKRLTPRSKRTIGGGKVRSGGGGSGGGGLLT